MGCSSYSMPQNYLNMLWHYLQELLDATVIRSAAGAKRVGKRWYFENLDLQVWLLLHSNWRHVMTYVFVRGKPPKSSLQHCADNMLIPAAA